MAAPDLTRAVAKMAELMIDECIITSDPGGWSDDAFDTQLLRYARRPLDEETVYEGQCMLRAPSTLSGGRVYTEGGVPLTNSPWLARVPLAIVNIEPGMMLHVIDAGRDQYMVGLEFKIDDVEGGTFSVSRRLQMTLRRPTVPERQNA